MREYRYSMGLQIFLHLASALSRAAQVLMNILRSRPRGNFLFHRNIESISDNMFALAVILFFRHYFSAID